jgi:GNAT superfamily N-acetyltransferase
MDWWFSYFTPDMDPRQFATLWECNPADVPGGLAAWALFSPGWYALDVFVHPALRGTPQAEAIWIEAEERSTEQHSKEKRKKLSTLWIAASDDWTIAHLLQRGFTRSGEWMDVMVRPLTGPMETPVLLKGFTLCSPRGEEDATLRALPQYAAFKSDLPQDVYITRYARFMRSSCYPAGFDLMLVAEDGRGAAFCIAWPDETNRVGLLEPVGVHPDFHRKGLGRAVVTENLRRLQECGMESAMVCGLSDLPDARAFYASMGFLPELRLETFAKDI